MFTFKAAVFLFSLLNAHSEARFFPIHTLYSFTNFFETDILNDAGSFLK